MSIRTWVASTVVLLGFVAGCSQPPQEATPPLAPEKRDSAVQYLASNKVEIQEGWKRGIVTASRKVSYTCVGGTCWNWEGSAMTQDGQTTPLHSDEESVYDVIQVGDDFVWKDNGYQGIYSSADVKVLHRAAVK